MAVGAAQFSRRRHYSWPAPVLPFHGLPRHFGQCLAHLANHCQPPICFFFTAQYSGVVKKRTRKPLPDRELQICRRLRQVRELLRLAQEEFAAEVGINRQRLASYEEGRAALRFDLALRICRQFIISEKWLATGKGDMRLVMDLTGEGLHVPADSSFGKAYDGYLAQRYEAIYRQQGESLRINLKAGDPRTFYKNLLLMLLDRWRSMLSPEEMTTLFSYLVNMGLDIVGIRVRDGKLPTLVRAQDEDGTPAYATVEELASSRVATPVDQAMAPVSRPGARRAVSPKK